MEKRMHDDVEGNQGSAETLSYDWGRAFSFFLGVTSSIILIAAIVMGGASLWGVLYWLAAAVLSPFLYKRKDVALKLVVLLSAFMILRNVPTLLSALSVSATAQSAPLAPLAAIAL